MDTISASGCIVTYNDREKVTAAVRSIMDMTKGVDFTLYISDNGSTDGTVEAIRESFPRVVIIENGENNGFGHGHNMVIPMLESEFHFVINPDIILTQDAISKMCLFLKENSDVGLICPKIYNEDGTEQFLPRRRPRLIYLLGGRIGFLSKYRDIYTRKSESFTLPEEIEFCTGCFMGMRTSVFEEFGGFDERYFMYFEDADLTRTIGKKYRTMIYPDAQVIHMWERAGAKSAKYFFIQVSSMFKYLIKWIGR